MLQKALFIFVNNVNYLDKIGYLKFWLKPSYRRYQISMSHDSFTLLLSSSQVLKIKLLQSRDISNIELYLQNHVTKIKKSNS